jgi:nucleotidyltransferase substrate binding protein (TIGR01987 family)
MGTIDYSPLGRAIERLKEGLRLLSSDPENDVYRDALIKRFEFTYGLCASMLERYLTSSSSVILEQKPTFPTLIRTASDAGLLRSGWDVWFDFRKARNLTSHVYNKETAIEVVAQIPMFAEEAAFLFESLKEKADDGN